MNVGYGRCSGTVKSFKGQWGFLTTDQVEGDVFLHVKDSPSIAGVTLRVGETIEFDLGTGGPNNQARALNATRLAADDPMSAESLRGTVKSFRRGWGLIDSPSVEGSLYFGERDNPQCKEGTLMPGDEVSFELGVNPADGRNKAINVQVVVKEQAECLGQRVRGTVKSFQDGWGFATSPSFLGTVLLGRKQVSAAGVGLQVGDTLEFEVSLAPNGKYEATNITKAMGGNLVLTHALAHLGVPAPPPGAPPMAALGNGVPPGVTSATARDRSRSPYASPPQGQYVGTVKTYRQDWGFLVCDNVPGDIYVNAVNSPLLGEPLQPGEAVSFDLVYRTAMSDKNNGATATNVQRLGAPGATPTPVPQQQWASSGNHQQWPAPAAPPSQQLNGTVVQFKPPPESWGWIECPAAGTQGLIFFGLRDNPQLQKQPEVGENVVFELGVGPKGRFKAVNVAASMIGQRVTGVVRSANEGWGFASTDGISGKVMLGKRALQNSGLDMSMLQVGETIEFEVSSAAKGYEALNIRKL